jgi:hypothetical protein
MFDKKEPAEALIVADEGPGNVEDTDIHGVHWDHHKYIIEVRPPGEAPFRIETKAKVPIFSKPRPGDVVKVAYDPKNHHAEIQIEGDERYDPKLVREREKQQAAARRDALLSGAPTPEATGTVHYAHGHLDDEPRWTVPAKCPECGARIDQTAAEASGDPRCEYCEKPLPRMRVRAHDLP